MFDPNTIYPSDYRNPANDIIGVSFDTLSAETKYQISPRFALSYQVGQLLCLDLVMVIFSRCHFMQCTQTPIGLFLQIIMQQFLVIQI